jgi:hypothetical protein
LEVLVVVGLGRTDAVVDAPGTFRTIAEAEGACPVAVGVWATVITVVSGGAAVSTFGGAMAVVTMGLSGMLCVAEVS